MLVVMEVVMVRQVEVVREMVVSATYKSSCSCHNYKYTVSYINIFACSTE